MKSRHFMKFNFTNNVLNYVVSCKIHTVLTAHAWQTFFGLKQAAPEVLFYLLCSAAQKQHLERGWLHITHKYLLVVVLQ